MVYENDITFSLERLIWFIKYIDDFIRYRLIIILISIYYFIHKEYEINN